MLFSTTDCANVSELNANRTAQPATGRTAALRKFEVIGVVVSWVKAEVRFSGRRGIVLQYTLSQRSKSSHEPGVIVLVIESLPFSQIAMGPTIVNWFPTCYPRLL